LPTLRVYCGFDPTAESLHLDSLFGIIVLSCFLRCGHKVVALVGGATDRVGDPFNKSIEWPELDLLALERNFSGISTTISRIWVGITELSILLFRIITTGGRMLSF
ncbi:tyrosine--tRNA ligase, chloroplastic mitochondrial-like, partial [Olea europaea subsp. europaea]